MDFVVSMRGKTVTIECKAGSAPSIGKGTYNAIDAIRPDCAYVVAPVEEPYPLNEKLSVVRLGDLDGIYKFTVKPRVKEDEVMRKVVY